MACTSRIIFMLQQCLADACVFRLIEEGRVAIIAIVHVDDIFANRTEK